MRIEESKEKESKETPITRSVLVSTFIGALFYRRRYIILLTIDIRQKSGRTYPWLLIKNRRLSRKR